MTVFVADEQDLEVDVAELHRLANAVLKAEDCRSDTEISVILVGDDEMAGYNRQYLEGEGPTDVISLPIEDLRPGVSPGQRSEGPPLMLGDVILAPDYIRRQADQFERDFTDEISLMTVHGILHLLGYDHDSEEDAEKMEGRESHILAAFGRTPR